MRMKTKIIAAAALVILLFAAACGDGPGGAGEKDSDSPAGGGNAGAGETEQQPGDENKRIESAAPVKDFGGYEFRVLSRNEAATRWYARDITTESETGDPFNDAVYRRNVAIEDRYNIKIINRMAASDALLTEARKSISSGGDDYDILKGGLSGFATSLSMEGMLLDLKNVPYLDLPKPWYDQKANVQLTVANKLYVTISEISTIDKDATWAYLFNKKLVADLSLENPYQLVRDGEWTIDKMLALCKDVSRDLDGDGAMGRGDLYGYAGETWNLYFGLMSAGHALIQKDAGDLPVYTGLDDAGLGSFNKLISMFGDKNLVLRADDWYGKGFDVWIDLMDVAFTENRVLLFDTSMARVQLYRDMEADFGIVPPPKRDAAQKEYISNLTVFWTNSLAIPATAGDAERTGAITDALAAESLYTVIPAYYDIQLKTKLARDDESSEMLDILFAGRNFDLGMIYNWGGMGDKFADAMQRNSPDIVSALEKIQDRIAGEITKTIEAYESYS